MNLQAQFQSVYSRASWIALMQTLFGSAAQLFAAPAPVADAAFDALFVGVLHLGDIQTADGKTIALLDIEVRPEITLSRNRAGIRHLAARVIDGVQRQGILAVFHAADSSDWRFSFIAREKSFDLATGQTQSVETPARRFTYLLGPNEKCRTAAERFASLAGAPVTLAAIEEAFKVDKLTREFYGELSDWYFWTLSRVDFPADIEQDRDTRNATMTIRLITRLIFVWFLKKKGLIPECLFSKETMTEWLTGTDATGSTYYKAILQNLFFATLNFDKNEGTRGFVEWGKKGVLAYRYKRFFKRGAADRFVETCRDIPFLNGGLFENLDRDVETATPRRVDCFSNCETNETRLTVPDELFFGAEQVVDLSAFYENDKRKSAVKVKGLFEILNAYNFTVEENTPYDKDVALDPELLGQVFENLLASYNPETRTTARKQTGSFYTPREIVQYMVDETLIAHLNQTVDPQLEPEYRKLTSYAGEQPQLSDAQKTAIVQALFTCKILDPACGSGAFPMGILQQMVHILNQLDPDNTYLKTQALRQVQEDANTVVNDVSAIDEKLQKMKETMRLFDDTVARPDYVRKLLLIENNIYGVDIQPVAVQIAKLRFFISLVVEQNVKDDIRPLPNLETNFVSANTLIGINKPADLLLSADEQVTAIEKELRANRHRHFFARTTRTKLACRREDKRLREKLRQRLIELATRPDEQVIAECRARIETLRIDRVDLQTEKWEMREQHTAVDFFAAPAPEQQPLPLRVDTNKTKRDQIDAAIRGYQAKIDAEHAKVKTNNAFIQESEKLALWDPYDQNVTSTFFDPEWMFGVKDGFNLVIGNPPYIQIQKFPAAQKEKWVAQKYQTYSATADIYCLFYERGANLLRVDGHLCYITSNKWMRAGYGEKMRDFFVKQTQPKRIVDFGGVIVFNSATVDSVIVLTSKSNSHETCASVVLGLDYHFTDSLEDYIKSRNVPLLLPSDGSPSWVVLSPERYDIKTKVEVQGVPLENWKLQINYGVKTGFNDAFYLTKDQRDTFITEDPSCAEFLVPLLRGRYINRYAPNWDGTWMINSHNGIKEADRPPVNLKTQCPLLWRHLENYEKELIKRQDKGDHWSNLRNCAYVKDFNRPKIMYPNMTKFLPFYFDDRNGYFTNDKGFIITSQTESLPYLTAFLNSHLFRCCFIDNFPNLGEDRRELRKIFVDKIPVKKPTAAEASMFERLVPLIQSAKADDGACPKSATFLEDLIDACVMECYFREHMAERDLLFHDLVAPLLTDYDPSASEAQQRDFLTHLHTTLNAPSHPIRQRLDRICTASPDLLAVIKSEGKV